MKKAATGFRFSIAHLLGIVFYVALLLGLYQSVPVLFVLMLTVSAIVFANMFGVIVSRFVIFVLKIPIDGMYDWGEDEKILKNEMNADSLSDKSRESDV